MLRRASSNACSSGRGAGEVGLFLTCIGWFLVVRGSGLCPWPVCCPGGVALAVACEVWAVTWMVCSEVLGSVYLLGGRSMAAAMVAAAWATLLMVSASSKVSGDTAYMMWDISQLGGCWE